MLQAQAAAVGRDYLKLEAKRSQQGPRFEIRLVNPKVGLAQGFTLHYQL